MHSETVTIETKGSIVAVGLLSFIGILVETSMNVTFPTLMKEMNVNLATVQWLTTAYLLLVTIVMSSTAFVLKRFSFRHIFFFAALMSLAGSLIAMLAPNFTLLLIGRLLQAIATGGRHTAYVSARFHPHTKKAAGTMDWNCQRHRVPGTSTWSHVWRSIDQCLVMAGDLRWHIARDCLCNCAGRR